MQVTCHLSRRWHQQFCQSPRFGHHQKCLGIFVAKRSYRANRGSAVRKSRISGQLVQQAAQDEVSRWEALAPERAFAPRLENRNIHEYEQFGSDKTTRRRVDPSQFLREEAEKVWKELQDVEDQLQTARKDAFSIDDPALQQLPADEREELLRLISSEMTEGNEEDSLDLAELNRLLEEEENDMEEDVTEPLRVTLRIPKAQKAFVTRFNKALAEAQDQEDDPTRALNLWKWYLRCQQRVPAFSSVMPETVWSFLWNSQRMLGSRPRHMILLGRDMLSVDQALDADQNLEMIRALHLCGDTASALKMWEESRAAMDKMSTATLSKSASMGIQLFAAVGRPNKAQRLALDAISKGAAPELLVHAIIGWATSREPGATTRAWVLYLKLRALLEDAMQPELYEKISDVLLNEKRSDMALAVFKDMISRIQGSGQNTLEAYQAALGNIPIDSDPEQVEQAINQTSLQALITIPNQYLNKFFFASWMKKLIGQGRMESAAMVVDLMYERNIKPDAMHLNGLIGAWLRAQSSSHRGKALQLAEEMIQARIIQVDVRGVGMDRADESSLVRKYLTSSASPTQKEVRLVRPTPAANHETFLLLLNHFSSLGQWDAYHRVSRTMSEFALLKPNILILNKFLSVELAAKALQRFWSTFNNQRSQYRCNVETFRLAWQAALISNTNNNSSLRIREASSARQLFGHLVRWHQKLVSSQKRTARREFDDSTYTAIVRTFTKEKDLIGLVCVIQGLHSMFLAGPDDTSVQLILTLAAQSLPGGHRSPRSAMLRRRRGMREDPSLLNAITQMISTIETRHKMQLIKDGAAKAEEVDDPESVVAKHIRVNVITELLLVVAQKVEKPGSNIVKTVKDVAEVMHADVDHLDLKGILAID